MIPTRPPLQIDRLGDHFGQYILTLRCSCGHVRQASPHTLAAMAGWDARLIDLVKRLRCSKCGARQCAVSVRHEHKRDG